MKVFNPEKELKKIQKGNKNKIIISVIALLLIIAIGSSYALYQIRYNKQIIYTTVAPFNKKDIIISVKLDDQEKSTDKFPAKEEGYVYSHIECENGNIQNANWNEDTWKLNAEINGPDKCTVFFVKSPFHMKSCENKTMSECLLEEGKKFPEYLAFDDPAGNARYIGATPSNYIWFNCDKYEDLTQETASDEEHNCEKWRIIGSFKNMEKVISVSEEGVATTEKQNLVKIIRNTFIGNIPFNNKGSNDWTNATLQINLNKEYLTENDDGSWITSEENIKSNKYTTSKSEDYKSITSNTLNIIENVVWNIGGVAHDILLSDYYNSERGSIGGADAKDKLTWNGKVALPYGSDAGYAIGGIRETCFQMPPNSLSSECKTNNWMSYIVGHHIWLLNPYSDGAGGAKTFIYTASISADNVAWSSSVSPSLYLTNDTKIISGDGTEEIPYIISTN